MCRQSPTRLLPPARGIACTNAISTPYPVSHRIPSRPHRPPSLTLLPPSPEVPTLPTTVSIKLTDVLFLPNLVPSSDSSSYSLFPSPSPPSPPSGPPPTRSRPHTQLAANPIGEPPALPRLFQYHTHHRRHIPPAFCRQLLTSTFNPLTLPVLCTTSSHTDHLLLTRALLSSRSTAPAALRIGHISAPW